jgi:hypothetical protein
MKGMNRTDVPLVHVPGWMGGWMDGSKSRFKDCLQQTKKEKMENKECSPPTYFYAHPTKPVRQITHMVGLVDT